MARWLLPCALAGAVATAGGRAARADDDGDTPVITEAADPERDAAAPAPGTTWLELNPVFVPSLQGLGTVEDGQRAALRIGPRTRARFEGAWWQNEAGGADLGHQAAIDVAGAGWRAGLQLDYDLGFAELYVGGALSGIESLYGGGKYVDLGGGVRRTWKVSRWTTIWIALGAGFRQWLGDLPPAGERNTGAFMLRVGGTFR